MSTEIQNLESTLLNADIVLKVKSNGNNLHYFKEIMQQAEIIEVFKGSGFEINQIIDIITPFRVLLFDDLGVTGSYNDFFKKNHEYLLFDKKIPSYMSVNNHIIMIVCEQLVSYFDYTETLSFLTNSFNHSYKEVKDHEYFGTEKVLTCTLDLREKVLSLFQ